MLLYFQRANTCVCCGAVIPEGTQVCYSCVLAALGKQNDISIERTDAYADTRI